MNARLRFPVLMGVVALLALGCSAPEEGPVAFTGDMSAANPTSGDEESAQISGDAPDPTPLDPESAAQLQSLAEETPAGCELLDPRSCLLPFPSDAYTTEDPDTVTGLRVDLPGGVLPNAEGNPLDPTEWNRNDGFSPSTPILVHVPGLDAEQTALPGEGDIGMSTTSESATVIVDLDNGQLIPHWAEVDQRATEDADRTLILRPAQSLPEGHRFGVALRDLKGSGGQALTAPVAYRALRDNHPTDVERVEERRDHFEQMFQDLASAGVNRADTYLAWDFTVASARSLAGRLLTMRDDAMGRLNSSEPNITVEEVRTDDLRDGIEKVVEGTFEVPLYLEGDGSPGSRMNYDDSGERPVANGTYTANFTCTVPTEAVERGGARPVVYGHGLLGSSREAASSHVQVTAAELNALYCATDTIGMSNGDVGYAVQALNDISRFPAMVDRMQQGMLNTLALGRLLISEDGFGAVDEFQTDGGDSIIDTESAYYDGNSQGAIMGGAITAVAQDWTKAVLGVGGMNYSTLLNRSVDFDEYAVVLRDAYPNPLDQQLVFGLLQMLWDRGETAGYVQHLTDRTYSRTPAKQVLMTIAYGDHQVATITAENIARTLRIPIYQPALPDDVSPLEEPFWNLRSTGQFPLEGSALFVWYSGTLPPPTGNITPRMSDQYRAECPDGDDTDDVACKDPHEDPRRQPEVIRQKDEFFRPDGVIVSACDQESCLATPRDELDY